jgi:site-specific recombinase XerD
MQYQSLNTGPSGIVKNDDGAFGECARRFQAHLEGQGYRPSMMDEYRRCINDLGTLMQKHGIAVADLSESAAIQLLTKAKWPFHRYFRVRRFIRFLPTRGVRAPVAKQTPPRNARDALRQDYEDYLRHQRGLTEQTIYHSWRLADRFLVFRFGDRNRSLAKLAQTDIVNFLQHVYVREQPYRGTTVTTHLRNFFRYLFRSGRIHTNLALGIPRVAHRDRSKVRRHLTPEAVETVLATARSNAATGRRDYAMLLLLARLGLRALEVVAMQIDDINWRAGEIIIRGKGQQHDRVPLPQDVGEALADYIRVGRVTTSRTLFVTHRAPHVPFKDGHILNEILIQAFAKAGMKRPEPYVGSHILRHSLATSMVQRGASLDEISNMLRHRSQCSTMIYAKVDIEGLRSVSQPWPVAGGAK